MPARTSIPNVSASARKASAQRMACVGPSNVMRWPSRTPRAVAAAVRHCERADGPPRRQQSLAHLAAAPRGDGGAAKSLQAGELLRRWRVVVTQLAHEARPQLGRIAVQVIPPGDEG